MKVWNIPKQEKVDMPYLINNAQHQHLCQTCTTQMMGDIKMEKQQNVWNPTNLPTMRLEDLADIEIAMMQKNDAANKKAQEEQKMKDE